MQDIISLKIKISLLVLATMGVMSGVAIVATLPLISHHFHDIENIDFLSKLLLTIPSIIVALFAPFIGIVVDKVGRLKPLYLGVFLFIVGGSSGFFLDNFYLILAGRAVLGFSVALVMTSSMALIGDYFTQKNREIFMSLQGMVVGLSGIVFVISGGYLAHFGWNYPFLVYALPLLFIPLLIGALKEPQKVHHLESIETQIPAKLLPVYLTGFFSMLLFYMLPTQIPYLIINELHGAPDNVGYFIGLAMFINAMVARKYAKLKTHFSFTQIFVIIYFFFSIGLLIISAVNTFNQLLFASVFMGIGFGLVLVNINVWLLSLVEPHKRGKAVGMLTSSFFFGQFFSPILFQPVVTSFGIQGLFFVAAILSFLVAIVVFSKLIFKRQRK